MGLIQCNACQFRGTCLASQGPKTARLVVVSDHPASDDLKRREAFAGRNGQIAKEVVRKILGVDPNTVLFTYAIRGDRRNEAISSTELFACRTWLWQDLQSAKPDYVLCLGNQARQAVLSDGGPNFKEARGRLLVDPLFGWQVFVTYGLGELAKYSAYDKEGDRLFTTGSVPWHFRNDLKRLRALMDRSSQAS